MTPLFHSLEQLLEEKTYSALFLDAYGVFWNGNKLGALPNAQESMEKLFATGKKIGIVSNSSQLGVKELKKYASHGFIQGKHFHFLLTSGDVAKKLLVHNQLPFPTPNKKFTLVFPPHPHYAHPSTLFDQTPYQETASLEEADFVYVNIPHISGEDETDATIFAPLLKPFLEKKKILFVANPDDFAHEGDHARLVVRQGSIAKLYKQMGGVVFAVGKPYANIYEAALEKLSAISPTKKEEILMVGDNPETDIQGARSFGIASALITQTGIMGERVAKHGQNAFQELPQTDFPNFFIERFCL